MTFLLRRTTLVLVAAVGAAWPAAAQDGSGATAGGYARLGFGARGMALGNGLVAGAGPDGPVLPYYNPALLPNARGRTVGVAAGLLSLDRQLNFLYATLPLRGGRAGLGLGLIHAGVSGIDGRDGDGRGTGERETSENMVYLAFGLAPSPAFTIGATFRGYQARLDPDLKQSLTVGFDLGATLTPPAVPGLVVAAALSDLKSRYKWNTRDLYELNGNEHEDPFPRRARLGASYTLPNGRATATVEAESAWWPVETRAPQQRTTSDGFEQIGIETAPGTRRAYALRTGVEVRPMEMLSVRLGLDRLNPKTDPFDAARPALGVGFVLPTFRSLQARLDYALVFEPHAPGGLHLIETSVRF